MIHSPRPICVNDILPSAHLSKLYTSEIRPICPNDILPSAHLFKLYTSDARPICINDILPLTHCLNDSLEMASFINFIYTSNTSLMGPPISIEYNIGIGPSVTIEDTNFIGPCPLPRLTRDSMSLGCLI